MSEAQQSQSIPMDNRTKRFYQGAAVGSKILEEHAEVEFPDDQTRVALFYFYAGALAVADHVCRTQEDFESFLQGLATQAPSIDIPERREP